LRNACFGLLAPNYKKTIPGREPGRGAYDSRCVRPSSCMVMTSAQLSRSHALPVNPTSVPCGFHHVWDHRPCGPCQRSRRPSPIPRFRSCTDRLRSRSSFSLDADWGELFSRLSMSYYDRTNWVASSAAAPTTSARMPESNVWGNARDQQPPAADYVAASFSPPPTDVAELFFSVAAGLVLVWANRVYLRRAAPRSGRSSRMLDARLDEHGRKHHRHSAWDGVQPPDSQLGVLRSAPGKQYLSQRCDGPINASIKQPVLDLIPFRRQIIILVSGAYLLASAGSRSEGGRGGGGRHAVLDWFISPSPLSAWYQHAHAAIASA